MLGDRSHHRDANVARDFDRRRGAVHDARRGNGATDSVCDSDSDTHCVPVSDFDECHVRAAAGVRDATIEYAGATSRSVATADAEPACVAKRRDRHLDRHGRILHQRRSDTDVRARGPGDGARRDAATECDARLDRRVACHRSVVRGVVPADIAHGPWAGPVGDRRVGRRRIRAAERRYDERDRGDDLHRRLALARCREECLDVRVDQVGRADVSAEWQERLCARVILRTAKDIDTASIKR